MSETRPQPRGVSDAPEEQHSSCTVKTSTRGTDISVYVVAGSPVHPACDEAVREYFWTFDRVVEELMGRGIDHRRAA